MAGAALADHLYDASAASARVAFEVAIRVEPGNPVLRFVYAQALVRLGGPDSGKWGETYGKDDFDSSR